MAQAAAMQAQLKALYPETEIEIVPIKTSGDLGNREQLGAFVHELQLALLDDRIDFALHCLKDLPTGQVPGLVLAAYLEREDPRDALIGPPEGLAGLAQGACVGTGSVRRSAQIVTRFPGLTFKPLVGNVDTRLRKLAEGEYDAIVLAMAGLKRLGLLDSWASSATVVPIPTETVLPAPGQAVLVLECRTFDAATNGMLAPLDHVDTRTAATAERAFLREFGSGCSVPVAALATVNDGQIELQGRVAAPDGKKMLMGKATTPSEYAEEIGTKMAKGMLETGAREIIESLAVVS